MQPLSTTRCKQTLSAGPVSPQFHVVLYDGPFFTALLGAEAPHMADANEINLDSLHDTISGRGDVNILRLKALMIA
jgi:hypothetical protein